MEVTCGISCRALPGAGAGEHVRENGTCLVGPLVLSGSWLSRRLESSTVPRAIPGCLTVHKVSVILTCPGTPGGQRTAESLGGQECTDSLVGLLSKLSKYGLGRAHFLPEN